MSKATIRAGREIERLFALGTVVGMTDAELLEQFVSGADESAARAFEVIVKRHGAMVFRVCRVILQDVHAADDAFQATFLVLARKVRHLRAGNLLGNWLYGVAVRTAQKARAIAVHRRIRESQAMTRIPATVHDTPDDFSSLKMIGAMVIAVAVVSTGSALIVQRAALARVPLEDPLVNMVSQREPDYENGAGRVPEQGANQQQRSRQADVDPDLVKLVPGPIVRTMPVSKDCMVSSYLPDWNFGNVDNLGIGNNDGGVRTLIDWPTIPVDEATSADRRFLIALYSRQTISHPPASAIGVFEITEDWPERTSWKTKPKYEMEPAITCKFEPGDGWKLIDVTPLIRAHAEAGRKGHGVVLRFLSEDVSGGPTESFSDYKLVSREGAGEWANRRPVLSVVEASKPTRPRSN